MKAPPPKARRPGRPPLRPETDIQAVLTVLGRRDKTAPEQYGEEWAAKRFLNLVATDLRGAHLSGAHLEGAILCDAHLEHAILFETHLKHADLWDAHLQGAQLWHAHLEHAQLMRAHLQGARFSGTHLQDASFYEGACFSGAHWEGADLREADGLTQKQLAVAFGDAKTKVAAHLRPAHWPAAAPEEPDNAE